MVTADPLSPTARDLRALTYQMYHWHAFSAYPEIVEKFSGNIYFWCTFNPIVDALKQQLGERKRDSDNGAGNSLWLRP